MSNIIFLVGARAAGKTTIGKILAQKINYSFVDTDVYFTQKTQKTVADIVEKEGWEGFRIIESQILREVAQANYVIATGGGMVLADANREFMKQQGTVFYMSAPVSVLAERLMSDPDVAQRPSLTGLSIVDELESVLATRQPLYHDAAHHVLKADAPQEEVIQQIMAKLNLS